MTEPLDLDKYLNEAPDNLSIWADALRRECHRLQARNTELATALTAIVARIDGDFDNPALWGHGPLFTDSLVDIKEIVNKALQESTS